MYKNSLRLYPPKRHFEGLSNLAVRRSIPYNAGTHKLLKLQSVATMGLSDYCVSMQRSVQGRNSEKIRCRKRLVQNQSMLPRELSIFLLNIEKCRRRPNRTKIGHSHIPNRFRLDKVVRSVRCRPGRPVEIHKRVHVRI
jgi:hypothetical protein